MLYLLFFRTRTKVGRSYSQWEPTVTGIQKLVFTVMNQPPYHRSSLLSHYQRSAVSIRFPRCLFSMPYALKLIRPIICPLNWSSALLAYSADLMDNKDKRQRLLDSAQQNLLSLRYFAITSFINESQWMFEQTFGIRFKTPMYLQKHRNNHYSGDTFISLSLETKERVTAINDLDLELYEFAKQLFWKRYDYYKRYPRHIGSWQACQYYSPSTSPRILWHCTAGAIRSHCIAIALSNMGHTALLWQERPSYILSYRAVCVVQSYRTAFNSPPLSSVADTWVRDCHSK